MSRLKQWRQDDFESQNIFARFQNAALVATLWGNANLPADSRIGAYSAGIQGYFSVHRVTNLDGLANIDIYERRRSGSGDLEYVRANNIEYVSDQIMGNGLFGDPFAHYQVITAFPLALQPPGQFFVAKIVDDPFPATDITSAGPLSNIEFVQWRDVPVFGRYQTRLVLIQPTPEPTRMTFKLAQEYARLRATIGMWSDRQNLMDQPSGEVQVRVLADGALVHEERFVRDTRDGSPLTMDVRTVKELVIDVRQRDASSAPGSFWLADVRFERSKNTVSVKNPQPRPASRLLPFARVPTPILERRVTAPESGQTR
jgi:hypothetical protein